MIGVVRVDINILCRLFQYQCRRGGVFRVQKSLSWRRERCFCCFDAGLCPRIATSTVDKKTDGEMATTIIEIFGAGTLMIRYAITGGEEIMIKNQRVTRAQIGGSIFAAEIR